MGFMLHPYRIIESSMFPWFFSAELAFSMIILLLCLLVYFKTKDAYRLTEHKGVGYFRSAFLFFGLSFLARVFLSLFFAASMLFIAEIRFLMPLFMFATGYLSTLAIIHLMLSLVWKKVKNPLFFIHSIALVVSLAASLLRAPFMLFLLQLAISIGIVIYAWNMHKKFTKTLWLYTLIVVSWLAGFIAIGGRRMFHFELKIILASISIIILIIIYKKINKWIK